MDNFTELKKRIATYSKINEKKIVTDFISTNKISFINIRDYLMEIGTVIEADEKEEIYVVIIKSGIINLNPTIVGILLKNETLYIAAYAKEGILNQNTAKTVIQDLFALIK